MTAVSVMQLPWRFILMRSTLIKIVQNDMYNISNNMD